MSFPESGSTILQEILASIVSLMLIEPLQEQINEKFKASRMPPAVIEQVVGCTRSAAPIVAERAIADPWWATQNVLRVWLGTASPEAILIDAVPACRTAVKAAQTHLKGSEA